MTCVKSVDGQTKSGGKYPIVDRFRLSAPELCREIVSVRREFGIHGGTVRARLGPHLTAAADIKEHDPAAVVADKLLRLFAPTVASLPSGKLAEIATTELNLRGEGMRVVERRVAHRERGGPSPRSSAEKMRLEIAPEMVRLILSDPSRLGTA